MIRKEKHLDQTYLVNFMLVSLVTINPIKETFELIKKIIFPADITTFFHHVLRTIYFQWNYTFYKQIDGVAMVHHSPRLSLKPKCWFLFVDCIFA